MNIDLLFEFGVFAVMIFLLVKSADAFITYAEKLGNALRLPHFLIGVLIVALGTSLPELATSIFAIAKGEVEMLGGNVLGSNIANVFLGLGLLSVITGRNIQFKQNIFQVHFPVFVISMVALTMSLWGDAVITRGEGVFLLFIMAAYLWFLFTSDSRKFLEKREKFHWTYLVFTILSLGGVILASDYAIGSILNMADMIAGTNEIKTVLAASLVAVGTSLPEFVVGFAAIRKGKFEILVGNILGSNIFNILLVVGVGSLITPVVFSELTMNIMLPAAGGVLFIYWAISKDHTITVQEGLAMTILYLLFLGKLFQIV